MNLWIVTIGSSDIQLDSDQTNLEKGRSEKDRSDRIWRYWYNDELKPKNYDVSFEPKPLYKDKEELYRIAPRLLGNVYKESSKKVQKEIWNYLTFPLLDNFVRKLDEYPEPQAIIVLLTDQSLIFADAEQRRKPKSPYWQDTCELEPILRDYFGDKFPNVPCKFIPLTPNSPRNGLDNWNAVLDLVQDKFKSLTIGEQMIVLDPTDNVYVSHQAGTPALSSAVQFTSLARFGDRVLFIVSSEQNKNIPDIVKSSSYLRGIKVKQANQLLDRHDYSGMRALISEYIQEDNDFKILLDAAIQWNFAKFDNFADEIQKLSDSKLQDLQDLTTMIKERRQNWWWNAYEEVYLAEIRRRQGSIVEAFFHSFRAFEGIFAQWGSQEFSKYLVNAKEEPYEEDSLDIPCLSYRVLEESNNYFSNKRCKQVNDIKKIKKQLEQLKNNYSLDINEVKKDEKLEEIENKKRTDQEPLELDLLTLCKLFKSCRYDEYKKKCGELKIFWDNDKENNVCQKRNLIVHQAKGMTQENLYGYWGVSQLTDWESRLLKFLNFIAKEDLIEKDLLVEFESFKSLEDASLMNQVHKALETAIANL